MTISVPGNPDYVSQQAATNTYLGSFAVNTGGVTHFDITTLIDPSMTGLLLQFLPTSGAVPNRVLASIATTPNTGALSQTIYCQSTQQMLMPLDGRVIAQGNFTDILINIGGVLGDANTTGVMHVWAVTNSPITYPQRKLVLMGVGTAAALSVPSLGTGTVFGGAGLGRYARIRSLSYFSTVAVAATAEWAWGYFIAATTFMAGYTKPAGAVLVSETYPVDITTTDGITFTNDTSVAVIAVVNYELWPA